MLTVQHKFWNHIMIIGWLLSEDKAHIIKLHPLMYKALINSLMLDIIER